jgi:lipopolysaccharide export system protein LptA
MNTRLLINIFSFLIIFIPSAYTQQAKQIKIVHADDMVFSKEVVANAWRLKGNVEFEHANATMFCDSAYFYTDKNQIDAFGNVNLHQGDTLHLYGETLNYDGNSKVAKMRDKVRLLDRDMVLTTDYLDFEISKDIGYYINGGKIVNKENTLTSTTGHYYAKQKTFYFRKKVVITNPDYQIKSDTLKYNTATRIAFFLGPTDIISKENYIYCENGWYNTATDISQFNKNAYLKSDKKLLKGDSLYYERNTGIGKAFNNIELIDSAQQVIITGNKAFYQERPEHAMITDKAVLMMYTKKDTLFIHADTLKSVADSVNKEKTIRAYFHVKMFKPDLQGRCDSLTYTTADSTVKMFISPVLWSEENQISSEYIELHLANKQLNTANFYNNSFIISMKDSDKFDQIKGRKMIGYFKDNQLYKVLVNGNGQTVYYVPDKDQIVGVNKALSSELLIYLENKKIEKILFLTKPDATLYPLDKAPAEEIKLRDFKWYKESRPKNKSEIFLWQQE